MYIVEDIHKRSVTASNWPDPTVHDELINGPSYCPS